MAVETAGGKRITQESMQYRRNQMQKELVIRKLKEQGCRITKQRLMLLDIILEEECSCCKEIYYRASKRDSGIGTATVYRMVNKLEEIGAISRKNMYRITCGEEGSEEGSDEEAYTIELDDHTIHHLTERNWNDVIQAGLKACGYIEEQTVKNVIIEI